MALTSKRTILPVNVVLLMTAVIVISGDKAGSNIDIRKIEINGPGLRPDLIVMPARYFFIYMFGALHKKRDDLASSADDIKVEITGYNTYQRDCRVWINLLNRKDGSFIARYKLYETCYNFEINVKFRGEHIGGSPFKINRTVQADECYCPASAVEWANNNKCPSTYKQINKDLQPFPIVNLSNFHDYIVKMVGKSGSMSICNYVILNNKVYRKCYGQHVGFHMFIDAILTSLARKVWLPDSEFFVNLGDWPLIQKNAEKSFPIFSWCGSKSSMDIVLPTYDITESSLESMGRVSLDMLSIQGNVETPWEAKEPKAFWRGRDSSRERLKLIEIARKYPDLFNASLTNFFFFQNEEHIYGPKEKHISFFKFFYYKYQINLDGTVAAYRFPYLLAGGSLVFKQDSNYYEHFYSELEAWKHFVPVKRDLSDLVLRIKWAKDNDKEAYKIALAGQEFARRNLLPEHIFCYHYVLMQEWSKRVKGEIKVRKEMENVPQTENKQTCKCDLSPGLHDEL